jgi:hypothetical protein
VKNTCGMQIGVVVAAAKSAEPVVVQERTHAGWVRALHFLAQLILLTIFGSTRAHANSPSILSYMDCARSIGVAINDRFAILPGERFGHRGLYVYTARSAYFLPLGVPHAEDGKAQEFLLTANIPNIGDILLNFRDKRPESESSIQPGISYQITTSRTSIPGNYRVTPANESLDDRARDLLRQRLMEKVATIKDFIDEKNRYNTPADAKAAFEKDRVVYLAKLEQCRIKDDRELNSVVAEEATKLESGLPGITVWEKQISGSLSVSLAR